MSASSENQNKLARVHNLSYAEGSFALAEFANRIGGMEQKTRVAFLGFVTSDVCRILLHKKKTPTHGKRGVNVVHRKEIAACILQKEYDDQDTPESLGQVLSAMVHVACRPEFRENFNKNTEDYCLNDALYRNLNVHVPAIVTVAEPEKSGFFSRKKKDAALEALERSVSDLFDTRGGESTPFSDAIGDSCIDDECKEAADLGAFIVAAKGLAHDVREKHPLTVHQPMLKAS